MTFLFQDKLIKLGLPFLIYFFNDDILKFIPMSDPVFTLLNTLDLKTV